MQFNGKHLTSLVDKELHCYGGDCSEEDYECDQDCSSDANEAMPKSAATVTDVWVESECVKLSVQSLALLAQSTGE